MGVATYALFCLWLAVASWKRPGTSLAAVLCMYGLEQWAQASHPFFVQHPAFTNFLVGGILVIAIGLRIVRTGTLFEDYPRHAGLILALFAYALVSTQWSPRVDISLNAWMKFWPYVITFIVLAPLAIRDLADLRNLFLTLLFVGSLIATLLLFFAKWETRHVVLGYGLHGNPLAVAQLAGMVGLTAIVADQLSSVRLWALVKWAILAVCVILVVRSGSRGQLLSLLFAVGLSWALTRRVLSIRSILITGFACVFLGEILKLALGTYWVYEADSTESRWDEQAMRRDVLDRLHQAGILLTHWLKDPATMLLGLGNSASFDPRIIGFYPHITVLEILGEEGLVGFALLLLILYRSVRSAVTSLRITQRGSAERACVAILVSMLTFTFILSCKEGSLLATPDMFMFAIILGKMELYLRRAEQDELPEIETPEEEQAHSPLSHGLLGHAQ